MALVLPFRPPSEPRRDVIAFYERLLERAKQGEIQGAVCILAISNADDEIVVSGELADNISYATSATRAGLACLAGQGAIDQGRQATVSPRGRKQAGA